VEVVVEQTIPPHKQEVLEEGEMVVVEILQQLEELQILVVVVVEVLVHFLQELLVVPVSSFFVILLHIL
jgi:hypothetical protein